MNLHELEEQQLQELNDSFKGSLQAYEALMGKHWGLCIEYITGNKIIPVKLRKMMEADWDEWFREWKGDSAKLMKMKAKHAKERIKLSKEKLS